MKNNRVADTTAKNYRTRSENLIMGAAEHFGVDRASLEQTEEYLLGKRATISKTSWICYRNALVFYLGQECDEGVIHYL